jgi:hypothetical protein
MSSPAPQQPRKEPSVDKRFWLVAGIALFLLVIFWAVSICVYADAFGWAVSDEQEKWGQFGDFMGGFVNPVIALAGFVGVLYTVNLQRQEIHDQRTQLVEERQERLQEERQRRCWELLRDWDSPPMAAARSQLKARLDRRETENGRFKEKRLYVLKAGFVLTDPYDWSWGEYDMVFGFLGRLNGLIRSGILSRRDVEEVFISDIVTWCSYSTAIKFFDPGDTAGSSHIPEKARAEWFDRNIVMLGRLFEVRECRIQSHTGLI